VSKARVIAQCRYILNRYPVGGKITDEDDELFLLDLFSRHPEWDQKQGVGVAALEIGQSEFRTKCFVLLRYDGSKTDISFMKCVSKPTPEQEVKQACRTAIRPTIYAFRNAHVIYGTTRCALTGEVLTRENTHIDHYDLTFDEMFRLWIKTQDLDRLVNQLAPSADNEYGYRFQDQQIIDEFIDFHDRHCQLRGVTREANLRRGSRGHST
jgi:hypothetical protein